MKFTKKLTKKTIRTVLSVLLVLMLLSSTLLFSGCGSSTAVELPDKAEGECGTGVTYEVSSATGKLTIKGSGEMKDYASPDEVPWASYRTAIEKIEIAEGVTGIGNYAFYYCTKVERVNIESTVLSSIGDYAFWMCSAMKDIEFPGSLSEIGESAFAYCKTMTAVTVSNLTKLGASAFTGCTALETVSLDGTLAQIPAMAFMNCTALKEISYPDTAKGNIASDALPEDVKQSAIKAQALLTIKYLNEKGEEISASYTATVAKGSTYEVVSPEVDGYTLPTDKATVTGTMPGRDVTVEVVYKTSEVETQPSTDGTDTSDAATSDPSEGTTDEQKPTEDTPIFFLVLLVVIIVAIVVGAILLMRSGKNITNDSQTVRKNDSSKNGKGKKK